MKKIGMFLIVLALIFTGCNYDGNVGDGKVDIKEAAVLRVAVGATLSAMPSAIKPALLITDALLAEIDGGTISDVKEIDAFLSRHIESLNLTKLEKQSVLDLMGLLRARILSFLSGKGITTEQRLKVVRDIAIIVNQSAKARYD